jgi:catechol 2,3-dioxygenase-like lactoylglutathione lyase family enzyme
MQIKLASVMVDDQDKALHFYTNVLGFVKKEDIPMGPFRWLTVTSPEGAEGAELVLEPMGFPPAQTFQKALFEAGIPATAFITNDISAEYSRLKERGVRFRGEP